MQRTTISLDDALGEALDRMVQDRGYASRSEAVRDLVRDGLERLQDEEAGGRHCVANLSYIMDRRIRSLPQRMADMQHAHHDLVAASTAVRLDHYHSIESVILKGSTADVQDFADAVRSERGVRFGAVNMLQVLSTDEHDHDGGHEHHGHHHLSPLR